MDDFEKAILISFDESGAVDSALKSQAVAFCQQIKENPSICSICIEHLCFSSLVQVQFWCLQCLHDVIRVRYPAMGADEKSFIRRSVFSMACFENEKSSVRVLEGPAFIKNKLAQVFVCLICFEYPLIWGSVFVDFLPNLSKGNVVIDMFCRILISLDEELISIDYPRNAEDVALAARVKDAIREQCVSDIVRAWYNIVTMYKSSDPELCASALDCTRRYVTWIDIGLVANDAFIQLLFELVMSNGYLECVRVAAASCLLAVVSKRMDSKSKLNILQSLQMRRLFGLVASEDPGSDFVSKIASLLAGYATEVLDCSKQLSLGGGKEVAVELLNEVLPSVFYVMQNTECDVTFNIVQFLSAYVGTMKGLSSLSEAQLLHVSQILEVIRVQIQFDPAYRDNLDSRDRVGKEEEDRVVEFRKDMLVLLRSVGRVAPDVTQMFIRNALAGAVASSAERNVEEVEASLSLLYALGEYMTDEMIRTGSGLLGELIPLLLSTRFPCHSNRLVALVYLETITRYLKFVQENVQYVPLVLSAFLDERGIHHSNGNVGRRASYLFMRVVKLLKANLLPYIEKILQSLEDKVAQFTNMDTSSEELPPSEDGNHIFEAIGLLIGMEEVPLEKQSEYLSVLLTPLCKQVEVAIVNAKVLTVEDSPMKIASIQQTIMAINALSKGFSERLVTASRPAIGVMFKQTLDVLLQILVVFPKIEPLRSKVTSFVHRMVDILGPSVFPYLPKAFGQLLSESQPKELGGFLLLLNQLICKFNTAVGDILDEVYPTIATRVFNIIPREPLTSGPGGITEEMRELQDLQRTFYTFLHVIATHDLSPVFLSAKSRAYLDPMMQLLLTSSCSHKDFTVRKACVQIFIRLIKDWSARNNGEEKVPGFQKFVIEAFATNCCLYSVLDKSFEFRDANTFVVFGEIVTAQKTMYEKFGNDFLVHFVSNGFPTARCPQELAEQYCQKLMGDDIKSLKAFYQKLIESLRGQQNGSLVFR